MTAEMPVGGGVHHCQQHALPLLPAVAGVFKDRRDIERGRCGWEGEVGEEGMILRRQARVRKRIGREGRGRG